ncbi:hypothetical protein B9G54_03120 [Alloscardovia macacae]|uniref:Uncharacterized protein n=1 Tax=Alloscardovia macacae TaxID=1160091 RepID=A0A1Y2T0D0_9BIFI|nr:hypothetical protein [Alloscardovia macacae]OTA26791.1 hypothetical protein B9G54_03120 [Alloscardovia macacae]OTA29184.1 hypothetical protein B9T39_04725 [Alloscardovia macacae]
MWSCIRHHYEQTSLFMRVGALAFLFVMCVVIPLSAEALGMSAYPIQALFDVASLSLTVVPAYAFFLYCWVAQYSVFERIRIPDRQVFFTNACVATVCAAVVTALDVLVAAGTLLWIAPGGFSSGAFYLGKLIPVAVRLFMMLDLFGLVLWALTCWGMSWAHASVLCVIASFLAIGLIRSGVEAVSTFFFPFMVEATGGISVVSVVPFCAAVAVCMAVAFTGWMKTSR